jgi:hypothetical protein
MLSSFRNKYSITSYDIDHGFFLNVATVIDGSLIKVGTKSKAIFVTVVYKTQALLGEISDVA